MLSRDTGDICWVYKTQSAVKSSPTVDPITRWIIIGSHDHHLYALNIEVHVYCISMYFFMYNFSRHLLIVK